MTELSPQAQAVLDAVCNNTEPDCDTQHLIAAALLAAVDQVVPEHREHYPNTLDERYRKVSAFDLRNRFLAIAAELEGGND
jgi:hypothetical protein